MIIILSSEPGNGKTYQSMQFEEPVKILDLENRNDKKLRLPILNTRLIENIKIMQFKDSDNPRDKYTEDYLKSYERFNEEVDVTLESIDLFETLVIDGISDLRNTYGKHKWLHDHPKRINLTPFEWGDINNDIKNIIKPLINMARHENKTLIMTAQMTDDYGIVKVEKDNKFINQSSKKGRIPFTQDWQDYGVDFLINLFHPENTKGVKLNQYHANFMKTPIGSWTENITDKSIYEILLEKGL